uniref:Marginal zone B- and B1-cell-specific protein-like n=1 Tax=Ciona intestinalis TaxID=7719 RepID=H2XPP2_CIOIN
QSLPWLLVILKMAKALNRGAQKPVSISMGPPDLSDEESQANYMPDFLRCEACTGISERFATTLQKNIDKSKAVKSGKKELGEEKLLEIFEGICSDKEWNGYGIKEVNGKKRIVYPGSDAEDVPGIMQGGGPWPRRLSDMCHSYLGEYEEHELYTTYVQKKTKGLKKLLCSSVCRSSSKSSHKKKKPRKTEL